MKIDMSQSTIRIWNRCTYEQYKGISTDYLWLFLRTLSRGKDKKIFIVRSEKCRGAPKKIFRVSFLKSGDPDSHFVF